VPTIFKPEDCLFSIVISVVIITVVLLNLEFPNFLMKVQYNRFNKTFYVTVPRRIIKLMQFEKGDTCEFFLDSKGNCNFAKVNGP